MLEFIKAHLRRFALPLGIITVGIVFIIVGIVLRVREGLALPKDGVTFSAAQSSESTSSARLFVDIAGAVESPGIYEFAPGARVAQVIERAGGLSKQVNESWIARNLNLAAKVSDGSKIYIPTMNEQGSVVLGSGTTSSGGSTSTSTINVNSASASQLDTLPGIGQVTAKKIIDGRPYGAIEELLNRKIVNQSTFEKIRDKITVY